MILAVLSGFILAACTPFLGKLGSKFFPWVFSLLPLALFVYFLGFLPSLSSSATVISYDWVPSFGINLDFRIDGLSILFALLISGVGFLVFFYSTYYLKGHPQLARFYGFLNLFMASMLGLVLSDNLMVMFIFWELTSISSFFLIGFNHDETGSRQSAQQALAVTGLGGLFLLAGFVLIGQIAGTYSLSALFESGLDIRIDSRYGWVLVLVFLGAFTKSAQFPFHFWLPGAMKAPTPISTYLHSATMVKAGIFLLARLSPALGGHPWWNDTLILVGGITMVYAAAHSLFRHDLKSILAYSTVSALGILVFLLGLGTEKALLAVPLFILAHALYKAALFLITGILDHQTSTRDVSRLMGLRKVMWPVAIAGFVAALSSGGFPVFLGFLSKEVMYEGTLAVDGLMPVLIAALVITKILLLVAGFWVGIKPFVGSLPAELEQTKAPSYILWAPPVLLGIGSLVLGAFPTLLEGLTVPAFQAITLSQVDIHLKLWHGFNLALWLSITTLVLGILLYVVWKPSPKLFAKTLSWEGISPNTLWKRSGRGFLKLSEIWTAFFQNGYLRNYVITILAFLTLLIGVRLFRGVHLYIDWEQISAVTPSEFIVVVLMVISLGISVLTHSRTLSIVALGVVGFANCLIFLFYSAPDLAMTQFSIDTLTVVLFMMVLFKLPKNKLLSSRGTRLRDGFISLLFGSLIAILTLEVFETPTTTDVSKFYADNAYLLAKGRNVVNIILVDYRASDTLVETVVLVIAAIGVFTLMKLDLNPQKNP